METKPHKIVDCNPTEEKQSDAQSNSTPVRHRLKASRFGFDLFKNDHVRLNKPFIIYLAFETTLF